MNIRITILCDNTVNGPLTVIGEHGYAAFIETERGNYLFDTGQGFSILQNAHCLKKDLSSIKGLFLSHGHYDHTGGLANVLTLHNSLKVYAHPDIFSQKYSLVEVDDNDTQKYIGMEFPKGHYEKRGAQFIFKSSLSEVAEGIYLTGEIPRTTEYEKGDSRLIVKNNGNVAPDPLLDDQALIIRTKHDGLIILLGCTHSGLINTIQYVLDHFRGEKLSVLIGGTHLAFLNDDQVEKTITRLKQYNFKKIGVSHCTGLKAEMRLFQEFKDKFFVANVGTSLETD
jgi:7,8-dihydropterin-6-yl-methyl-4-(beta-D-ribofuranosyl)aminobenzene 5'-phosphate synthase